MNISIDIKLLLILIIAFIPFIVIVAISHEYGHITVAKFLGYETKLHYASMYYDDSELSNKIKEIYSHYKFEIEHDQNFSKKAEYESGVNKLNSDGLLISIGGPLQTIITGMIGFLILMWRRKSIYKSGLNFSDWLAVFLTLFWLREIFNLITSIGGEIISPNGTWFGGDELYISQSLNLWSGTISIILGIIGLTIITYITFKLLPKKIRLIFITSGFIGGIFGFILWVNIIGPKILP